MPRIFNYYHTEQSRLMISPTTHSGHTLAGHCRSTLSSRRRLSVCLSCDIVGRKTTTEIYRLCMQRSCPRIRLQVLPCVLATYVCLLT